MKTLLAECGGLALPRENRTKRWGIGLTGALVIAAAVAFGLAATARAASYEVPIYISEGNYSPNRYTIWAGLDGGPIRPYLFDTGAPNMFTVVGAQGGTVTGNFSFAQGLTYNYFESPVAVTLGNSSGGAVVTTGTANVAAVVSITSGGNTTNTSGGPLADGTYGDFGAGLYGNSTLATILSQVPLAEGLQHGWVVNVAGLTSGSGTLTIGLTTQMIQDAKNTPGAITMVMDKSGSQIPTATGFLDGYNKAQVAATTVTLSNNGTVVQKTLPTVFDTGGGPNVVIYDPAYTPAEHGQVTVAYGNQTFVDYTGTTPWGGNVTVDSDISGGLRVNPGGATIYQNYSVMFHLTGNSSDTGELILVPAAVPEASPAALLLLAACGIVGWLAWQKSRRAAGLLVAALLAGASAASAQISIPLELVNIGSNPESPQYKLGIWIGLGGGQQKLYEFDTGGEGFWAGHSNSLDSGVTQWWGNYTSTGQSATITYSSNITYTADVVDTSIQIYGNGTSSSYLFSTGNQTVSLAKIQSATQDGANIYQPIHQGDPFLQNNFFGDFGASLMPIISGTSVLFGALPQIPVAALPGTNLDAGFIVNTGGYGYQQPMLTLGISTQDNDRFATQVPMSANGTYTFPTTGLPAFEEKLITANMTLSNSSNGTSAVMEAPLILDTGATTGSIRPGPTIPSGVIAPYLNGSDVITGTEIRFTAAGAPGFLGLNATFTADTTVGLNKFGVDTTSQNPNSVNLGLLGFNTYETMFNLTTGNVGFTATVPEPSGGILLASGLSALLALRLCASWRRGNVGGTAREKR